MKQNWVESPFSVNSELKNVKNCKIAKNGVLPSGVKKVNGKRR